MKILLTTRVFTKNEGVAKFVVELAERLVENHEVYLLTSDYKYKIAGIEEVYEVPVIKKPFVLQALSFAIFSKFKIPKIKKEENIDIVHTQKTECFEGDIVTMHSCHKASVKIHGKLFKQENSYPKYILYKIVRALWPLNRLRLFIEKRVVEKGSRKLTAVSKGVKEELIKNYNINPKKITTVPNGIDIEKFSPNPETKKKIKAKYNIEKDEKVLMFCGNNFRGKGLDLVIKALPKLEKSTRLFVVGRDDFSPYAKLASRLGMEDKITFIGGVEKNIENYYQASDIFVFPTKYESFSLATMEALACGTPALVTKVNGPNEFIEEGENGLFIERSPENIASKINKLLKDTSLLSRMKEKARKTTKQYSWNKIAKQINAVYKQHLKQENEKA